MPIRFLRCLLSILGSLLLVAVGSSAASAVPGDLVPTFGSGGLVAISDFGTPTRAGGMTLQSDGKIVTVGETTSEDWAISRFNPNGTPDTSFSGDGLQTLDMGGSDSAADVAIQPDGKLVVLGWASVAGHDVFGVARYTADGTLDTSFSGDGIATTDLGTSASASAVALQSDGRIVVVGVANGDYALARYNADGSLDGTFGSGGTKTTNLGYAHQGATAVAIQPDGKLVVTGLAGGVTAEPDDFLVLRYTADGNLDPSFSGDGIQTATWSSDSNALDVALQPDGKIVVIGDVYSEASGGNFDFGVVRYLPDGTPDSSFGDGGQTTVSFGDGNDFPQALALQADGRIVIAGGALAAGIDNAFGLARLNPDGTLDAGFGDDGKVTTVFDAGAAHAYGVAIQADGQIVAVGNLISTVPGPDQLAMARYEGGDAAPVPQPPINTALPEIGGTAAPGSTLSASPGSWSGDTPQSYSYQWLRDGGEIGGATGPSYTVTAADQGHQLAVQVTATNSSGSVSATSAVASVPAPPGGGQQPGGGAPPPGSRGPIASAASIGSVSTQGGVVMVQVRCSHGSRGCPAVTAQLSVVERLRGGKVAAVVAKQRVKTRLVVIGKATIRLAPGQIKTVTVSLNRTGRALLARFKRITGQLMLTAGGTTLKSQRVGLRKAGRRAARRSGDERQVHSSR